MTIENSTNDKAVGPMAMLSVFDNMVEVCGSFIGSLLLIGNELLLYLVSSVTVID